VTGFEFGDPEFVFKCIPSSGVRLIGFDMILSIFILWCTVFVIFLFHYTK